MIMSDLYVEILVTAPGVVARTVVMGQKEVGLWRSERAGNKWLCEGKQDIPLYCIFWVNPSSMYILLRIKVKTNSSNY